MKRVWTYFVQFLWGILSLLIAYLLAALVLSLWSTNPPAHSCETPRDIFLTTNGVHVYLILPVDLIEEELRTHLNVPAGVAFLSFGWGDADFYRQTPTWADLKLRTAVRAILLRSQAAVHVTFYTGRWEKWRAIALCTDQLRALNDYLVASFEWDARHQIQPMSVTAGYGPRDFFYQATGNYTGFRTCNVWANEALKAAEVSTAVWSPFDWGVLWHVEE